MRLQDRDKIPPAGPRIPARGTAWPITRLIDSQGATEGTVANETAEAIADITSSGDTLRANHLKILSDGLILASQATLWRSRIAEVQDDDRAVLKELRARLG